MSDMPDWAVWIFAAGLVALFIWYFWHVGRTMIGAGRHLVQTIQNWPQIRRRMVEEEVRAGGRYPWWYRAIRVFLVLAMIALATFLVWRKFSGGI